MLATISSNSNINMNRDSFSSQTINTTVSNTKQQRQQLQLQQQQQQATTSIITTSTNLHQQQYSPLNFMKTSTSTSYLNNSNRLDRLPIDSINNNNNNIYPNINNNNNLNDNNLINVQNNSMPSTSIINRRQTGSVGSALGLSSSARYKLEQLDLEAGGGGAIGIGSINSIVGGGDSAGKISGSSKSLKGKSKSSMKRNTSLISFKSFDFHIKSIYSGLRNKSNKSPPSDGEKSSTFDGTGNGSHHNNRKNSGKNKSISNRKTSTGNAEQNTPKIQIPITTTTTILPSQTPNPRSKSPPFVHVEHVDPDESCDLLINYPQSPYQSRRSSYEPKSSSQLLNIHQYEEISRSQASSPFLCPSPLPTNIRRSSTSDIMCKKSGTSSGNVSRRGSSSDSRRPSTSDLLRRNRERKGSEGHSMMGTRSISHGGLPRGGHRGGRRTSIAF